MFLFVLLQFSGFFVLAFKGPIEELEDEARHGGERMGTRGWVIRYDGE
jgi:hypothetical protein